MLQLAKANGAIIVSPNYRLMPEATGLEILSDMDAFWLWLQKDGVEHALQRAATGLRACKSQILVLGESAGRQRSHLHGPLYAHACYSFVLLRLIVPFQVVTWQCSLL